MNRWPDECIMLLCTLDSPDFCNLEMTRLKQSEKQPFQSSGEQQMDQLSMRENPDPGADFSANQHTRDQLISDQDVSDAQDVYSSPCGPNCGAPCDTGQLGCYGPRCSTANTAPGCSGAVASPAILWPPTYLANNARCPKMVRLTNKNQYVILYGLANFPKGFSQGTVTRSFQIEISMQGHEEVLLELRHIVRDIAAGRTSAGSFAPSSAPTPLQDDFVAFFRRLAHRERTLMLWSLRRVAGMLSAQQPGVAPTSETTNLDNIDVA
jgi:hypothetical protein